MSGARPQPVGVLIVVGREKIIGGKFGEYDEYKRSQCAHAGRLYFEDLMR